MEFEESYKGIFGIEEEEDGDFLFEESSDWVTGRGGKKVNATV